MGAVPGTAVARAPGGAARLVDRTLVTARHGLAGVALRLGAMAVAAAAVGWFHRLGGDTVPCPLRALSGVPCPLCGGTTAFIELGSGRPVEAVLANPVALGAAAALAVAPLGPGRRWWASPPGIRAGVLGCALAGAELWQLARFDLLHL